MNWIIIVLQLEELLLQMAYADFWTVFSKNNVSLQNILSLVERD
jgi:hypothetical protein